MTSSTPSPRLATVFRIGCRHAPSGWSARAVFCTQPVAPCHVASGLDSTQMLTVLHEHIDAHKAGQSELVGLLEGALSDAEQAIDPHERRLRRPLPATRCACRPAR